MLLVLEKEITQAQKNQIRTLLSEQGGIIRETGQNQKNVIGAVGLRETDPDYYRRIPGVAEVIKIDTPFKLVSRQMHPEDSQVRVGNVVVGGERIVAIAGPCAVESREQALTIARQIRQYGAVMFRGGAFKPRTSPYSFQGMEEEGLKILAEVREQTGLRVVTEITSPTQADLMMKYIDVVQVGARNMQNFELLKCVGRMGKPVVLKRGLASTIEEWLMSAEYILSEGNNNVILCERGIRTFEPYTRNTLDMSAIPVLKKLTHLPVVVDPSHATGIREKVSPMARSAVAAGADGLMIEVHHDPDNALSDGPQSLYPQQFGKLMRDIYVIAPVVGKQMDFGYIDKAAAVEKQRVKTGLGQQAAYLGEPGTFSHKACLQYFGEEVSPLAKPSFKDIFEAVKMGQAAYGIVPIENSLAGSIHENYDYLLDYDLKILGEITLRIVHHLIGQPGSDIQKVDKVLGPSPAIQQCRQFLGCYPDMQIVPVAATASAVRAVKEAGDARMAAIGSQEAAEIYGMQILSEGIEDDPRNYTRFVIVGKQPVTNGPYQKSSMVFSVGNQPGSLFEILKIFSENQINMVKLESRPIHGKPWEYMFYADIEADGEDAVFKEILALIQTKTDFVRVLGSY